MKNLSETTIERINWIVAILPAAAFIAVCDGGWIDYVLESGWGLDGIFSKLLYIVGFFYIGFIALTLTTLPLGNSFNVPSDRPRWKVLGIELLCVIIVFSISYGFSVEREASQAEANEVIRAEGYDLGYDEGYDDGYERGFEEGDYEGYRNGYYDAEQELTDNKNQTSGSTSNNWQSNVFVFITYSGSKYHTVDCQYLWNSSSRVSLATAKAYGYSACSVCDPPR